MEGDAAVQHLALVAEQLGFAHTAERHVEQAGLVHVGVGRAQHGDGDTAGTHFLVKLAAQAVRHDRAGKPPADNQDFLCH